MKVERLIFCPICGRHVMKSSGCTDTTIPCRKCGSELMFSVDSDTISIRVVRMSPKQKKSA